MTITTVAAQPTVDELLAAVKTLDATELAEFETGFEQIWRNHSAIADPALTEIVEKHRLPLRQQARMRELLFKNQEGELTEAEETELDFYMAKMDQALEATANEMLELAELRKQKPHNVHS